MPIYEYRCNDCGHQFEVSQRMADDPISECPVCEGVVVKVLFAPAIHFKGKGFHNTDYGTRRRPVGDDSSGGGSAGDGGSNGSSDSKTSGDKVAAGSTSSSTADSSSGSSGKKTVGLDKV